MKNFIIVLFFALFATSLGAQKKDAQVSLLYQNYLNIKNKLASDDSEGASKAATAFIKTASMIDFKVLSEANVNALRKDASIISDTRNIDTQRESFYNLSDNMLALTKEFKLSEAPVFVQYCPMADGSWLSSEKKILNPYYGSEMLSCGSVKSEIK